MHRLTDESPHKSPLLENFLVSSIQLSAVRPGRGPWRNLAAMLGTALLASALTVGVTQAATPYPGGIWEPGPAKYASVIVDKVPVRMDDGVVLNATVSFPADLGTNQRAAGNFPVVVERTPYVTDPSTVNTYFSRYGYISVRISARGTFLSGGESRNWSPRDGRDGKAIVEWAAYQLDGSDGRVAMAGCSFPGGYHLIDAAAVGRDSPLKAIIASCIGLESQSRQLWMVDGLLTKAANAPSAILGLEGNTEAGRRFWPAVQESLFGGGKVAYAGSRFWKEQAPMSDAADIARNNVAVLLWTGWGDVVEQAALRTYVALQNAHYKQRNPGQSHKPYSWDEQMKPNQPTTPRFQIVISNAAHGGGMDREGIYLQWIETWLKGVDTGIQNTRTPMHLLESVSNRWINTATYPMVQRYTSWYLDGAALNSKVSRVGATDTLYWGSTPGVPGNLLSYTTPPFAEGATIAGPVGATIYASSTNTNLELIAHLYDVAPDGTATQITRGAVLASLRDPDKGRSWTDLNGKSIWPYPKLEQDSYIQPGQVYKLNISLAARQWSVLPNHRLRLDVAGQNPDNSTYCPIGNQLSFSSEVCPRYLTPQQRATLPGGIYTVLQGRDWPSALNVPQTPLNFFPAAARTGVTPGSGGVVQSLDWGSNGVR